MIQIQVLRGRKVVVVTVKHLAVDRAVAVVQVETGLHIQDTAERVHMLWAATQTTSEILVDRVWYKYLG